MATTGPPNTVPHSPTHRAVAGHEQAAALVAARDELEEQARRVRLEGQVAEFVHHQQLGLGVEGQAVVEPPLGAGAASAVISAVACTNSTEWPSRIASRPSATAR